MPGGRHDDPVGHAGLRRARREPGPERVPGPDAVRVEVGAAGRPGDDPPQQMVLDSCLVVPLGLATNSVTTRDARVVTYGG